MGLLCAFAALPSFRTLVFVVLSVLSCLAAHRRPVVNEPNA